MQYRSVHPQADLLLYDKDTPRHLGHTLIDLGLDENASPDIRREAQSYRQSISGRFFAQLDEELEQKIYIPAGVAHLLQHIQWSSVGKCPAEDVHRLYITSLDQGAISSAFELEDSELNERDIMAHLEQWASTQIKILKTASQPVKNKQIADLFETIKRGDTKQAIHMLEADAGLITSQDEGGSSPLHFAAHKCQMDLAEYILSLGGSVDIRDLYNQTPLHWAACQGIAHLLLEHGANIEERDNGGWTPLYATSRDGHIDSVRFLICKGADINARTNEHARFDQLGWTPLHIAAKKGRKEVVRLLLAGGADIRAVSDQGETPLQVAEDEEIKDLIREAQHSDVQQKRSQKFEQQQNIALHIALQHLALRYSNLRWANSSQPYIDLKHECQSLMNDSDFVAYVSSYLEDYPDISRCLASYAISVGRQHLLSWNDLPKNINEPTWHGLFVERWRPAFLILDSPAKYFLNHSEGPLYWRNLPVQLPNLESASWLLRQQDFKHMRNGFAHTNFGWESENNESMIVAYDEETGESTVKLRVVEAESFYVIVTSIVSVLLDTICQA